MKLSLILPLLCMSCVSHSVPQEVLAPAEEEEVVSCVFCTEMPRVESDPIPTPWVPSAWSH